MRGDVLVLNGGSSSIKVALYDGDDVQLPELGRGQIDGIGGTTRLRAFDDQSEPLVDQSFSDRLNHTQAMVELVTWGRQREAAHDIAAVGHRVVHGGMRFDRAVRVDAKTLNELQALSPLAPLHQPYNLARIRSLAALQPALPQIACFDTAFHRPCGAPSWHTIVRKPIAAKGD